ncbi:MAG TPA: hydrogenase maturation nickel metallochaperone HypA, partial [Terriglobales bacterium]|nr:hydrogenase maturation nickel metallochaperone HypA [Terriglobales bacterium]
MHELSIAMSLVEIAGEEAERQGGRVAAVHLKLGAQSSVVKDALFASYEMACEGTPLAGSRLVVEDVPGRVFCSVCREPRTLSTLQHFCCPDCATPTSEILQGKEIEMV